MHIFVRLGIVNMNKNLAIVKRLFDSIVLPILYSFGVDMFLQDGDRGFKHINGFVKRQRNSNFRDMLIRGFPFVK